jgi:hypothetical protein
MIASHTSGPVICAVIAVRATVWPTKTHVAATIDSSLIPAMQYRAVFHVILFMADPPNAVNVMGAARRRRANGGTDPFGWPNAHANRSVSHARSSGKPCAGRQLRRSRPFLEDANENAPAGSRDFPQGR